MAIIKELDLNAPLSVILKDGTHDFHETARSTPGATWLTNAELDRDEYIRYQMMLWHVYDTMEKALDRHANYPTLQHTYNPALLARAPRLEADISALLQVPTQEWKQHPLHKALMASPPQAFADFLARLEELSVSSDPSLFLGHAYVRYLGDLSGGQTIRYNAMKAYGLDPQSGCTFFEFKQLDGTGSASLGEMKRIKEWYKKGLDAAGGDDKELKAKILDEALLSFKFHDGIFSAFKPPSAQAVWAEGERKKSIVPPALVQTDKNEHTTAQGMFTASTVIAFIVAVGLAHFLLVVGGFTSTRGYQKLAALEQWLDSLRGSSD